MMRRMRTGMIVGWLVLGMTGTVLAAPRIYKWVKDHRVSSQSIVKATQASRVISLPEDRALEMVRTVMTDGLYLALAEYHATRHRQDAETTVDSVLPEDVVGQNEVELADEDYRFILEVKLKAYGKRTRVTAVVYPMYRIRDYEAEDEANSATAESAVEVKIRTNRDSAVALGPIFVAPIPGSPYEYHIPTREDAAERSAQLVRSFIYLLDRELNASSGTVTR